MEFEMNTDMQDENKEKKNQNAPPKKRIPPSVHDRHGGSQRLVPTHGRSQKQTARLLPGTHADAGMSRTPEPIFR